MQHRPVGTSSVPTSAFRQSNSFPTRAAEPPVELADPIVAEAYGREMLGEREWGRTVFKYVDDCDTSASTGYLLPAEFAMLVGRLRHELGGVPWGKELSFDFNAADRDRDGRISIDEWGRYADSIERTYGSRVCKRAAMRLLGSRSAENRILKNNIYVFSAYRHDASLSLMRCCAKWGNPFLLESIEKALDKHADPNCSMATPCFNGYTPLIFLAMAQPIERKSEVSMSIDRLIEAKADVHRECDKMPFGKWPPLRFAAQLQNRAGVAALLPHVDVGEVFAWAAKEAVEYVMLAELEKLCGVETCKKIAAMDTYSNQATVLMQLFASNIVGGDLTPDGAENLINGTYQVWSLPLGHKADPNGAGLDGLTALMHVVMKDDLKCVKRMLSCRAAPNQADSRKVTPLHFAAMQLQPEIAHVLLDARAEPHSVDHAGLSAWMLVGEHRKDFVGADERERIQDLLGLLRPEFSAERVIEAIETNTWEELLEPETPHLDALRRRWRLGESLFFNDGVVRRGAFEGRSHRPHLLMRVVKILLGLLELDPLEGNKKLLTKYLLEATFGPTNPYGCDHIKVAWTLEDNRSSYRAELTKLINTRLSDFEADCQQQRQEIKDDADVNPEGYCAALLALEADVVTVPSAWQESDPFWRQVQERQILRYDPPWSLSVENGLTICLALLRLGAVTDLSQYCYMQQVDHAGMEEMQAHGYLAFAELCNERFQDRLKEIAAEVAVSDDLDLRPAPLVKIKGMKRLMQKTLEAKTTFGDMSWEGLSQDHLSYGHCFHILDAVRLSFTCGGDTVADQVTCCMKLLNRLRACTVEDEGICVLRQKSSFAEGVAMKGGYADVKLLVYADLGSFVAFDGTDVLLRIVGEVQLILEGYMKVKKRMHLVYEVDRGSFDRQDGGAA